MYLLNRTRRRRRRRRRRVCTFFYVGYSRAFSPRKENKGIFGDPVYCTATQAASLFPSALPQKKPLTFDF
jgi:hypothetical protein